MLAALLLTTQAGSTRAADDDDDAPEAATLTQEWVGLELTPVAVAFPNPPTYRQGSVSTYQAGPGANIRFGRHRWQYAYVIPFQLGLFVSTAGTQTIFLHMQAEGGLIVPGTDRRLEIGLGLGFGVLSMAYSVECDGACALGGTGWLLSLGARGLIIARPTWTMGVSVRWMRPQQSGGGGVFGDYVGGGTMLFTGLEFGFGRS
jgi:hypothetical protein